MDQLVEKLSTTTLNNDKLLYVDILNFSTNFFKRGDHWSFRQARRNVEKFVKYAKNSNLKLKVFIDAFIESDESIAKWRGRREIEVRKGERNMPQGMNTLLGDLFRRYDVEVCYSVDADNDDTLAAYAQHDGADVLSQDRDFLRYRGRRYTIYRKFDWDHKKKQLILTPRTDMKCRSSERDIISPPPQTKSKDPGFVTLPKFYLRGTPSPLTHHFTNLHITVRPLRQAYYAHLGVESYVREEFPIYLDSKVQWGVSEVQKDNTLLYLLNDPKSAYIHFFKDMTRPAKVSDKDWNNHVYATHVVVLELCGLYMNIPLYDLLIQYAGHKSVQFFKNNKPGSCTTRRGCD